MTVQVAAQALIVITLCGIGLVDSIDHGHPSPVLIISGYTGSRLYVQDETDTNCSTNDETIRIWINRTHRELLPNCFINQMKLTYSDGRYSDAEGVTISTSDFGKLSSLADLTDILSVAINDSDVVDYLVERGYVIDKSIRAAPYDWRLGTDELNQRGFYVNLKKLVEQMYQENGNTKVTLVVISMGGPVSLYFLTQVVNQEWKDTYIHSYISLGADWSGANGLYYLFTAPPISSFLGAYEINVDVEEIRDLYASFATSYFLLPHKSVWKDTILLSTPTNNYTASDYQQLFTDAGYPQSYTRLRHQMNQFPPPNVPTYCFYGLGFPTVERYIYGDGFPDTQPTFVFGEGDGIVNKASLEVCQQWANSGYPFNRTIFQGYDHFNITYDIAILESIRDIVGAPVDPLDVCELPVDQGPCRASIPRYFFNPEKGVCQNFTYGGCNGNSNNFETLEECNQRCNPNGCPPICTKDYCSNVNTRRSLCTLPSPRGDCDAKCRITYCHTCYYADEHRPLPGDCDTCSYYPEVHQAANKCFKRWAVCTRRANGQQYTKARGRKERRQDRFKCYEHPCV